ncbi:MAG: tetratricopeptide repeat-containing sensor histidine kinase [Candidatus Cloacimonadota bacterium]|nr:tetratricopeptide repeat-containing sensor histidine kinase [Candidatus Cloacimonadota bacterium]
MKRKIEILQTQLDEEKDIRKKVDLALKLSSYYRFLSREDKAFKYTEIALEEAKKEDYEMGIAKIYKEISLIHYYKFALDKAIDYCFQALSIFKTLGRNKEISDTMCNIGVYYNALNLPEKAKEYFFQSLKYYEESVTTLNNIGEHYAKQKDFDKAIDYFQQTIKIAKDLNKQADLAYAFKSIGEVYIDLNQNEKAIKYLEQALQILKFHNDPKTKAFTLIGLSNSYLNGENPEKALTFSLKALKMAEDLNNNEIFWFCYNNLAKIYEALKNYKQANDYLKLSLKLQEQMYSGKITHRIAELEATYEIEKKELETKRLLEKSARLASIGVMTAGITHEINQPLNSIVINSDGILFKDDRDKVLPEGYRQSVEKIFKSAQRIDQIIKHMRTYWNSGDDLIKNKSININNSINDALEFLNQQIRSHGIKLHTSFTFQNPLILGNKVHIEQIIINLITNSIHALDRSEIKTKKILIKTKVDNGNVIIHIKDNGIGLTINNEKNIFDPFYSTKKPDKGMGLGLSIVKNYITQMNGEILFENIKTAGVVFKITLPVIEGKQ